MGWFGLLSSQMGRCGRLVRILTCLIHFIGRKRRGSSSAVLRVASRPRHYGCCCCCCCCCCSSLSSSRNRTASAAPLHRRIHHAYRGSPVNASIVKGIGRGKPLTAPLLLWSLLLPGSFGALVVVVVAIVRMARNRRVMPRGRGRRIIFGVRIANAAAVRHAFSQPRAPEKRSPCLVSSSKKRQHQQKSDHLTTSNPSVPGKWNPQPSGSALAKMNHISIRLSRSAISPHATVRARKSVTIDSPDIK